MLMFELLPLSIGIGLVVSLLFSEFFGLAAGGMVVPGYIALRLSQPLDVLLTLMAAFFTFAIGHSLSSVIIVYGRRRTVMMILVGYLMGVLLRAFIVAPFEQVENLEFRIIGYIIPGLIGIWMDRQGIVETLSALLVAAVVVRLVLILFIGSELQV
jgi:poly-gamma-glutamate biosynthesis protein PgsC/CapC